jgi:hypothetical protein
VTWWLGELTTPAGLAERLLELGLAPDADEAEMTSFTIDRTPAGEPTVEVRGVETVDDYLRALELDWEVWDVPEDKRGGYRPIQREAWASVGATGRMGIYLAYDDGEPVGFGRVVFAPAAGILMGGSTLPAARGRGVYTSLVHARGQRRAHVGADPRAARLRADREGAPATGQPLTRPRRAGPATRDEAVLTPRPAAPILFVAARGGRRRWC